MKLSENVCPVSGPNSRKRVVSPTRDTVMGTMLPLLKKSGTPRRAACCCACSAASVFAKPSLTRR